jgi:hypothetical protein
MNCPVCPSTNTVLLQAIPWLVAAVAVYISFRQWRTADDKLKLDLYNRRFAIYLAALEFYQTMVGHDAEKGEIVANGFVKYYRESQFLFAKEDGIFDQLKQIQDECTKMLSYNRENAKPEKDRNAEFLRELHRHQMNCIITIPSLLTALETKLEPYLNFRAAKSPSIWTECNAMTAKSMRKSS